MKIHRFFLVLLFGIFLYGDVMYEMTTASEGMMGMGGEATMRVFVKGDYLRTETTSQSPMTGETTDITIIRLDKRVIWTLYPEEKEYAETEIEQLEELKQQVSPEEEAKVEIPEIKVERTGEKKKILNKNCEKIVISMDATSEEGVMTFTQTMWITKEIPGFQEINNFNKKMSELGMTQSSAMKMGSNKESYEELQKKTSEIEGFPLEMDLDMTMGAEEMTFSIKMHSTVTNFNTKPIDRKVFEIPTGYTLKD